MNGGKIRNFMLKTLLRNCGRVEIKFLRQKKIKLKTNQAAGKIVTYEHFNNNVEKWAVHILLFGKISAIIVL